MDTNKMRDPVREQFEVWFRKEYQLAAGDEINFANGEVRMMLKGWLASRAAVVVELPEPHMKGSYADPQVLYAEEVRQSIEAQGLRVKP